MLSFSTTLANEVAAINLRGRMAQNAHDELFGHIVISKTIRIANNDTSRRIQSSRATINVVHSLHFSLKSHRRISTSVLSRMLIN